MKHNQGGFGHIALVLVVAVVVAVGAVGWMVYDKSKNTSVEPKQQSAEKKDNLQAATKASTPKLQNLGLKAIGPYDKAAGTSGDFTISDQALREYDSMGMKGFYVFGDKLGGKTDNRKNPNFEFASLRVGTPVVAVQDGEIAFIKQQQDSGDYEVFMQFGGSEWTIGYDHITDLKVKKGDIVKAGDQIGTAAVQGNGLARFELQINRDKDGVTTFYCPALLLDESVKAKTLTDITALQDTWELFSGKNLYTQETQKTPGCLSETMTVAESEGR